MPPQEWIGPTAALTAALVWSISSVLYSRVPLSAATLTTAKNVFAAILMGLTLWLSSRNGTMFEATSKQWTYLAISGLIGLVVGDIAYFRSLQILGPRQGLTLTLLTPPVTAVLGEFMLGESLRFTEWAAIGLTLLGLGVVMNERSTSKGELTDEASAATSQAVQGGGVAAGTLMAGLVCSAIGILCQALGSIVMKIGTGELRTIEATFIRMIVAAACSVILTTASGEWSGLRKLWGNRRATVEATIAAFLGTFIGVWLMLTAFKYSRAGIASTLTSTSPLFVIPIVSLFLGEKITTRAVFGATLAFGGVCWLVLAN
ncbi:MAG: DMT family transporter [Planctomycetota bacterium]